MSTSVHRFTRAIVLDFAAPNVLNKRIFAVWDDFYKDAVAALLKPNPDTKLIAEVYSLRLSMDLRRG